LFLFDAALSAAFCLKVPAPRPGCRFVGAAGEAGVGAEIAAGDLEHGVADGLQRAQDMPVDDQHAADAQHQRAEQQAEMQDQPAHGRRALSLGIILGGAERAFCDSQQGRQPLDRELGPVVWNDVRLLAGQQRLQQFVALVGVVGGEEALLGVLDGGHWPAAGRSRRSASIWLKAACAPPRAAAFLRRIFRHLPAAMPWRRSAGIAAGVAPPARRRRGWPASG
jgi:hypothetical protein